MRVGKVIQVMPSKELTEMRLGPLSYKKGVVRQIMTTNSGKLRGCWVEFVDRFLGEDEWYIPADSIG